MDIQSIHSFLSIVNQWSAIPGILFYILFRKRESKVSRLVFTVLLISFLADFSNYLLIWVIRIRDYYPFMTSYVINSSWFVGNYFLLSALYKRFIPEKEKLIRSLSIIFLIGFLISLYFYGILETNPFLSVYSSLSFTTLSIIIYKKILEKGPVESQLKYPVFWIVTGNFLFYSATVFKGLVANYLIFDLHISALNYFPISLFTLIFNTLKNLMLLYALFLIENGHPEYVDLPQKK